MKIPFFKRKSKPVKAELSGALWYYQRGYETGLVQTDVSDRVMHQVVLQVRNLIWQPLL